MELELDITGGNGRHRLLLPKPGDFESFYVFSMEFSGHEIFWRLLVNLMEAAGRPVVAVHEIESQRSLGEDAIPRASMSGLLCRRGYGFGVLFDSGLARKESALANGQKLVFLRDPRSTLLALYGHQVSNGVEVPESFVDFLNTPNVAQLLQRYRGFVDLWCRGSNVCLFRHEQALSGWHSIACDLAAQIMLPLDPHVVAAIAATAPPLSNRVTESRVKEAEMVAGQALFADISRALGYSPSRVNVPNSNRFRVLKATEGPDMTDRVRGYADPDPTLYRRLRPNSSVAIKIRDQTVVMDVDATGCRPVIGQPVTAERTLAVYGSAVTYGTAIPAKKTFCSLLQGMLPTWRVENHGVPGYSGTQSLMQLERQLPWNKPEFVTFCCIPQHLGRNVLSPFWLQRGGEFATRGQDGSASPGSIPRAGLDAAGNLKIRQVALPGVDFIGADLSEYAPDPYYLNLVCFHLFERANQIVTGYGGHFFVTTLQGHFSRGLSERMSDTGIPVVDASVASDEQLGIAEDVSASVSEFIAGRIYDYIARFAGLELDLVRDGNATA